MIVKYCHLLHVWILWMNYLSSVKFASKRRGIKPEKIKSYLLFPPIAQFRCNNFFDVCNSFFTISEDDCNLSDLVHHR